MIKNIKYIQAVTQLRVSCARLSSKLPRAVCAFKCVNIFIITYANILVFTT